VGNERDGEGPQEGEPLEEEEPEDRRPSPPDAFLAVEYEALQAAKNDRYE
jgi:hypothetical protein